LPESDFVADSSWSSSLESAPGERFRVGLIRSAACHRCAEGSNVHDSDEEAGSNVQDSALPKSDLRVKCLVAVPPAPGFRFGGHFVALAVRRAFCVTGRCTAPTRGPNIRG